jgi:hypothetical protein
MSINTCGRFLMQGRRRKNAEMHYGLRNADRGKEEDAETGCLGDAEKNIQRFRTRTRSRTRTRPMSMY